MGRLRYGRWIGALLVGLGGGYWAGVGEFGAEGTAAGVHAPVDVVDGDHGVGQGPDDDDAGSSPDERLVPMTRLLRMTHAQWERTVQELLYLDEPTGLSRGFQLEPLTGEFFVDDDTLALEVDQARWQGYQRVSVELARWVAADDSIVEAIAPSAANEAERARGFIEQFGMRAFRRPLSEPEVEDYLARFERGGSLYEDSSGFEAGVRHVLESMMQSPFFLYRIAPHEEVADGAASLASWEVVSRASLDRGAHGGDGEWLEIAVDPQRHLVGVGEPVDPRAARAASRPAGRLLGGALPYVVAHTAFEWPVA